ncbi:MAG: hypothetical protein AAGF11_42900 [Myxococcota bacterium]
MPSRLFPWSRGLRCLLLGGGLTIWALGAGCKKTGGAAQEIAQAPTMESVTGESKCGVRSSAAKPLVIEWPAAERAALEARATRGLVAVRYEGCEMEVLTSCTGDGEYEYLGLTQKREGVKITNADELYAQLPVGAAGLEGKLERSGQLNVDMVIVGRREADKTQFTERDFTGRCAEITHVITGLTVGAFTFYSGKAAEVGGGVTVGNVGVGTSSSTDQEILKSDGNAAACAMASSEDLAAPEGCGALLRVEVVEIDRIFGSKSTSDGSGSSSSTKSDTPPKPVDPKLERKIRNAKLMITSGYLGAGVGVATAAIGLALYQRSRSALEGEQGATTVSPDRQDNISNARTGLILSAVGGGVGVLGLGLTLYGSIRLKSLQRSQVSIRPLWGPRMAGVGLRGRF